MSPISSITELINRTQQQLEFEQKLAKTVASLAEGDIVHFDRLTAFAWDTVVLFGEYTSAEQINTRLNQKWIKKSSVSVDELTDLVVFTLKGQVVEYVVIHGDLFVAFDGLDTFTPGTARFRIKTVPDPNRPKVLIPVRD